MQKKTGNIRDNYRFLKRIGNGSFSEVYLCEHRVSKHRRCVKAVFWDKISNKENLLQEIEVLKELDHPHILRIYEYYITARHVYIVSEYLEGGEMFDRISKMEKVNEMEIARIFEQVLSAVAYLHSHNIIHRDLKPENIMFESKEPDSNIKLIDFGSSKRLTANEKLRSKLGTCYYIAPEVLLKQYDHKCDIWSCGVILYILLCGYPPFNGRNEFEIFSKIIKGEFIFPEEEWAAIRPEAKALVRRMLAYDPEKRPEAVELLSDPWFTTCQQEILNPKTLNNLKSFHINSLFKKAIMLYLVKFFELTEEKNVLLESFKAIDKDHDGQLTREELIEAYEQIDDVDDPELTANQVLANLDFDNSNTIDFSEFLVANLDYKKKISFNELQAIFKEIDADKDGFLSSQDLEEFFANGLPDSQEVSQVILSELDANHDGKVSFREFEIAMKKFIK